MWWNWQLKLLCTWGSSLCSWWSADFRKTSSTLLLTTNFSLPGLQRLGLVSSKNLLQVCSSSPSSTSMWSSWEREFQETCEDQDCRLLEAALCCTNQEWWLNFPQILQARVLFSSSSSSTPTHSWTLLRGQQDDRATPSPQWTCKTWFTPSPFLSQKHWYLWTVQPWDGRSGPLPPSQMSSPRWKSWDTPPVHEDSLGQLWTLSSHPWRNADWLRRRPRAVDTICSGLFCVSLSHCGSPEGPGSITAAV